MAVSAGRTMVDGGNIMLFTYNTTSGKYESIAHGTSHSLSLSADTQEINTKDAKGWRKNEVNRINWEIQAEHMYTDDGYQTFYDAMISKEPVKVVFGLKTAAEIGGDPESVNINNDGNWNASYTSYVYAGDAVITSLSWNAEAGQKSTVSATLTGDGEISKSMLTQ